MALSKEMYYTNKNNEMLTLLGLNKYLNHDHFIAKVYSGKDYLRLAGNSNDAKLIFKEELNKAINGDNIIYVVSEKEHLELLPDKAFVILMTEELDVIKERFSKRMNGNLPKLISEK